MQVKLIFFCLLNALLSVSIAQTSFNRVSFYAIIIENDLKEVNDELLSLDKTQGKQAYKGALLMKKSGLLPEAKDKLSFFKEGRKELEQAISRDSTNVEYRFLRILIQENAPKIVNYNREIKKDASYLRKNYKNLPDIVQKALLNYSKTSKELKPEDFKNGAHG